MISVEGRLDFGAAITQEVGYRRRRMRVTLSGI
jgi:hypothetical protein